MAEVIFKAEDYKFRADLEMAVRQKFNLTTEPKKDCKIIGTREALANLQLSDRSTFWGIPCVINDFPTEPKAMNKVYRGEQTNFGINNKNNQPL